MYRQDTTEVSLHSHNCQRSSKVLKFPIPTGSYVNEHEKQLVNINKFKIFKAK